MTVECPCCKTKLNAYEKHIGQSVKCPRCHSSFIVPSGSLPPDEISLEQITTGSASINEQQYNALAPDQKYGYELEWKCQCNECGNIWHYLDRVERNLANKAVCNACDGAGEAANPCGAGMSQVQNTGLNIETQIRDLITCSKCRSQNVSKEKKYFKRQQ